MRLLLLITLVAALLRFSFLLEVPPANRDELSIGYNAYSLIKTGADEHAVAHPLSFQAFGDYKLPGLIYMVAGILAYFPLTEWAIRLPNAILGTLMIPLVYLLSYQLFSSRRLSITATLITTLSWWHIHASRSAYEPLIGLFFSTLALYLFLSSAKKPLLVIGSLLSSALAFVSYNTPVLLLPLMEIAALIVYWPHLRSKKTMIGCLVITTLLAVGSLKISAAVSQSRNATTIFGNPATTDTINHWIYDLQKIGIPHSLSRLIANKGVVAMLDGAKGYAAAISPAYLFFTGDQNPWHNLRSIHLGNINPFLIAPILYGIARIISRRRQLEVGERFLIAALLVTPLANAITVDAPITNRLLDFHLLLEVLAAYGLYHAYVSTGKKLKQLWVAGFSSLTAFFLLMYPAVYPHELLPLWNPGAKALFKSITPIAQQYTAIYITEEISPSYIYAAVFTPIPPSEFQQHAVWTTNGFRTVSQYRQYHFTTAPHYRNWTLEWATNTFRKQDDKILVIHDPNTRLSEESPIFTVSGIWPQPLWIAESITPSIALSYFKAHPQENPREKEITTYLSQLK